MQLLSMNGIVFHGLGIRHNSNIVRTDQLQTTRSQYNRTFNPVPYGHSLDRKRSITLKRLVRTLSSKRILHLHLIVLIIRNTVNNTTNKVQVPDQTYRVPKDRKEMKHRDGIMLLTCKSRLTFIFTMRRVMITLRTNRLNPPVNINRNLRIIRLMHVRFTNTRYTCFTYFS